MARVTEGERAKGELADRSHKLQVRGGDANIYDLCFDKYLQ